MRRHEDKQAFLLSGLMFRHERPQKVRFRQFHQVDVEVFGTINPLIDAELIWIISRILGELGVKNNDIEINSVGCRVCRESFREKLIAYFKNVENDLCGDCIRRLERNPLRIFDCKNISCIDAGKQSPLLYDSLRGVQRSFQQIYSIPPGLRSQFHIEQKAGKGARLLYKNCL